MFVVVFFLGVSKKCIKGSDEEQNADCNAWCQKTQKRPSTGICLRYVTFEFVEHCHCRAKVNLLLL